MPTIHIIPIPSDVSFDRGTCDKEMLVFVYVYGGAVACGFAVLGLLVSCCACSKATVSV